MTRQYLLLFLPLDYGHFCSNVGTNVFIRSSLDVKVDRSLLERDFFVVNFYFSLYYELNYRNSNLTP